MSFISANQQQTWAKEIIQCFPIQPTTVRTTTAHLTLMLWGYVLDPPGQKSLPIWYDNHSASSTKRTSTALSFHKIYNQALIQMICLPSFTLVIIVGMYLIHGRYERYSNPLKSDSCFEMHAMTLWSRVLGASRRTRLHWRRLMYDILAHSGGSSELIAYNDDEGTMFSGVVHS